MHYELVREYPLPTLLKDSTKQLDSYPPVTAKWHIPPEEWDTMTSANGGGLEAPYDGPSHIANHPWRDRTREKGIIIDEPVTPDNPLDLTQLAPWDQHLERDNLGRPLHPLGRLGVTTSFGPNHKLGMYTGLGRFY